MVKSMFIAYSLVDNFELPHLRPALYPENWPVMNLRINRKLLKRNENTQMRSDVQGEVWSSTLDLVSATRVPAVQTGQIYTNLTCAELLTTQWPGDSNAMKSEQFSTTEFDPLSLTCLPVPGLPHLYQAQGWACLFEMCVGVGVDVGVSLSLQVHK